MADYYETLGVSKTATDKEIKSAYSKQALKWHPDRNKSEEATKKFKEVTRAYEVLSDSSKKQTYDQYGHEAFERSGGGRGAPGGQTYQQGPFSYTYSSSGGGNPFEGFDMGGFSDPFEIFEQFFGVNSPFGGQQRRPQRSIYQVLIEFDEAINGVEKEFVIEGKPKKIKIPAGVDDGMRIRFSDFDLLVSVKNHPHFKRQGQDIYLEREISYPEAVLGTVVEVPTVKGKVKLKVRPGTKSGTITRLRDHGVPYPNSKRRGDQYVVFNVKVPEKVTGKAKKLIEELAQELK